ncbi:hypothetical protein GCM10008107_26970 [Psychrosphaera saromensis]|nr:hypothetical protein GCM10008107_26970 [Psychrosphaera saromensis]GLQ14500.1 hypothetical protein GCM10007917_19550 [Psychrosphaera saromensis]
MLAFILAFSADDFDRLAWAVDMIECEAKYKARGITKEENEYFKLSSLTNKKTA